MTTPKIRFFNSSSEDSVAYAIHGKGSYLVIPAWWVSHLELDWKNPNYQNFFQSLGEHHTIVRYDRPGVGLSSRVRTNFELDDEVGILTELIEHLSIKNCSLLGFSCGGPPAIEYANRYPHVVDKIVLAGSFVDGQDIGNTEIQNALCAMVSASWGLGAKAIIDLFDPEMDTDQRIALGKTHSQSSTPSMAASLLKLTFNMNVVDAAKSVIKPVLVLHKSNDRTVSLKAGKQLAMTIPNAQFKIIDGKTHLPWSGLESKIFINEILNFTTQGKVNHTEQPNQFRKEGDIWRLHFSNITVQIKDALGLHNIAQLIANSGKEIHVRSLIEGEVSEFFDRSQAIEVLDHQSLNHYRKRLNEIEKDKATAAVCLDETQYLKLETEEEFILKELNKATGLGGKTRSFNTDDEKARKTITARIRNSIKRIKSIHPALGSHLEQSILTGHYCSYMSNDTHKWLT